MNSPGKWIKLAFHSRRVEVETYTEGTVSRVEVDNPWGTIERREKPRPRIYESDPRPSEARGTRVAVYGHPPDVNREYTFADVKDYIQHRTFVGYTKLRDDPPQVHLAVGGQNEPIEIGFPELQFVHEGSHGPATQFVNLTDSKCVAGTSLNLTVTIRGLYSVEAARFGLSPQQLNTGLILSVNGIPYFESRAGELHDAPWPRTQPERQELLLGRRMRPGAAQYEHKPQRDQRRSGDPRKSSTPL